jgi:peptide/nickel transport system permease protein
MLRYATLRVLSIVPVGAVVVVVAFLLLHLAPGDPAALIAGDGANAEQIEAIRVKLHLDQPLLVQFGAWLGDVARLDLGTSVFTGLPVLRLIGQRIEPTLMLATMTMVLTVLYALPLGMLAAWRVHGAIDRAVAGFAVLGFSVPVFVVAYALIYVFAVRLSWLPVQGYQPLSDGLLASLRSLLLPSIALSILYGALLARVTRAAMLDVLGSDYIRAARARGFSLWRVMVNHALRNAGLPVVTVIGLGFATLLGGVVVTESVFNIPGVGRLVVEAVLRRDYPVVQGALLVFSAAMIAVNLLVDLAYGLIDPRVRG